MTWDASHQPETIDPDEDPEMMCAACLVCACHDPRAASEACPGSYQGETKDTAVAWLNDHCQ